MNDADGAARSPSDRFRLQVAGDSGANPIVDLLVREGAVEVIGSADRMPDAERLAHDMQPDVIVVDLSSISTDEAPTVGPLRQASPASTIVAVSSGDSGAADAVLDSGAHAYLHQSVNVERLADLVVEAMLAGDDEAHAALPATHASARPARNVAARAVRVWGRPELQDTVKLLVSELVTNAIRHADSHVEVRMIFAPDVLRIEVRDDDPGMPTPRAASNEDESGRGLALVDNLADAWGARPVADGKKVWFELHRS